MQTTLEEKQNYRENIIDILQDTLLCEKNMNFSLFISDLINIIKNSEEDYNFSIEKIKNEEQKINNVIFNSICEKKTRKSNITPNKYFEKSKKQKGVILHSNPKPVEIKQKSIITHNRYYTLG
jgi:hypothetical protein